jgi:hypothetical protein
MGDKVKEIRFTEVDFSTFTGINFIPPATFYILNASGKYVFYHHSDRATVQAQVDRYYGKGKYTIKASKLQKTNSKLESGGYSCTGVGTRKGQNKPN